VLTNFNIANNAATSTVTLNGTSYANSLMLDTSTGTPPAILTNWLSMCTNLANPRVGVIFTPRASTDASNKFSSATYLRMRIFIQWDEAQNRRRIAFFDTTKINRQQ
jgi:hypothetical protein